MNLTEIAKLNAEIWFLHDQKKFAELSITSKKFLEQLGYAENTREAGELISKAYLTYDLAWGELEKNGKTDKFKEGYEIHKKIRNLLKIEGKSYIHHHNWWMKFGKKNYLMVFYWVIRQHLEKYGFRPIEAIKASLLLGFAGTKGHDTRNFEVTVKKLEKYWKHILNTKINEILIY